MGQTIVFCGLPRLRSGQYLPGFSRVRSTINRKDNGTSIVTFVDDAFAVEALLF